MKSFRVVIQNHQVLGAKKGVIYSLRPQIWVSPFEMGHVQYFLHSEFYLLEYYIIISLSRWLKSDKIVKLQVARQKNRRSIWAKVIRSDKIDALKLICILILD